MNYTYLSLFNRSHDRIEELKAALSADTKYKLHFFLHIGKRIRPKIYNILSTPYHFGAQRGCQSMW